jgi:hypothetical protein
MIWQTAIDNLKTVLASISTTNGYRTNAGSNIYDWFDFAQSVDAMPLISIEDALQIDNEGGHVDKHTLSVDIKIFAYGSNGVVDIRKIAADIYEAIGLDESLGKICYNADIQGFNFEKIDAENSIMCGTLKLVLYFKTKSFDANTLTYV